MRIADKILNLPPIAIRLLARRVTVGSHIVALTDAEIAQRSGLSAADVKMLSWTVSWDDVTVSKMMKFTRACGVDFENRRSVASAIKLLKTSPLAYLRRSPQWESFFKLLIIEWQKHG